MTPAEVRRWARDYMRANYKAFVFDGKLDAVELARDTRDAAYREFGDAVVYNTQYVSCAAEFLADQLEEQREAVREDLGDFNAVCEG